MAKAWCPPTARLPMQPLLDLMGGDTILGKAKQLPGAPRTNHSQLLKWRREGLSPWTADRAAVRAGFHPLSVWGDDWLDACAWIDPEVIEEWRRRDVDAANARESRAA